METKPRLLLAKRLLLSLVSVLVVVGGLEVVVRLFGLDQSCRNLYSDSGQQLWVCDPILTFKLKPDLVAHGKPLNRAGFRSREFLPKQDGVFRIVALGDSCTFGVIATQRALEYVREPYPQLLERLAAERIGVGKVEVLNAGVPAYNSFHGVMLLRTKLRDLEPDLITVRYGWNDHFVAATPSVYREPGNLLALEAQDVLLRTALYGFLRRLGMSLQRFRQGVVSAPSLPAEWKPSVPRDAYQHNLRRIVSLARDQGAQVWLLTSPHAFVIDENRGRYAETPMSARQVLSFNAIPSFERLIEIHDDYNQATREVGAELGVPVVDMDAVYKAHSGEPLFLPTDVPHPTAQGHALEAETLYQRLRQDGLLRRRG